jgi:hypothetical protein
MHNKIRVLGVLRYILLYRWANNVDLEVVLSGPTESSLCERGRKTHIAQFFRNFRVA